MTDQPQLQPSQDGAADARWRPPRVRIWSAIPGKTVFEGMSRELVKVHRAGADPAYPKDIIVIPVSQGMDELDRASALPDAVWSRPAAGRAVVVFDAAGEGHRHLPARSRRLHAFAAERGIAPEACAYLTQDRGYRQDYLAHCRQAGIASPMQVIAYDYWIQRCARELDVGPEALEAKAAAFRARPARRERRFISLNFTLRPTKALFLLKLRQAGLWDEGFVSCGGLGGHSRTTAEELARRMRALDGFQDLVLELMPDLGALERRSLMEGVIREDGAFLPMGDTLGGEHDRSWFTVVPETEMGERPWRITEKPLKPLANFHPLVVLGNPGALAMIRELGFRTFDPVIDERYDDEPDPRRRFDMVFAEVQRLCALDEADLARKEGALAETLAFNAGWAHAGLPRLYRERRDPQLLDQLLSLLKVPTP
jgi:hypothetical protein